MKIIVLLGRFLFSFIFILSGVHHFSGGTVAYAANQGVPYASFLVPASGILAMLGGLSILFGFRARVGAWMLVLFLIPVTFVMHNWWDVTDPMLRQMQMANFNKNMALLGGALIVAYYGSGAWSIDKMLHPHKGSRKLQQPHKLQHI